MRPNPLEDLADDRLVALARQGERQALVVLYHRYVAEVFGFAMNGLGDREDAEDVTAETFARVVDNLDAFRGESSFRTWLYAIARNQVRDVYRRNGRHPVAALDVSRLAAAEASDGAAAGEGVPRWSTQGRAVLERLPENYRAVLTLRILEERSVRETAHRLGLSEGNVKVLQHRALKRAAEIARALGPEPGVDDEAR
jgi:RNA polymerase sigma-70 factor (ECF subfamily)